MFDSIRNLFRKPAPSPAPSLTEAQVRAIVRDELLANGLATVDDFGAIRRVYNAPTGGVIDFCINGVPQARVVDGGIVKP